jgi:molecular chaperone HtpG
LFESSLLLEGYLKDPHAMVARINDILEKAGSWYSEIKKI